MNIKRKFQIVYSILTVILGSYLIIESFALLSILREYQVLIASIEETNSNVYNELAYIIDFISNMLIFYYIIGAVIILFSSLSFKNKNSKSFAITLIVLISILFFSRIGMTSILNELTLSNYVGISYFDFLNSLCIVSIGFLITYISVGNNKRNLEPNLQTVVKETTGDIKNNEIEKNLENIKSTNILQNNDVLPEKIKILKQLKDMGEISEEEYKKLLLKELSK